MYYSLHRSLRIPSAFCGLYTLRPSYERLPYCNAVNAQEGQESVSSVLGPMANSLSGVKIFVKAVLDAQPWRKDPLCIRKEWSDREYALDDHGGRGGKMCFAIMWDNGVIKPHPPLRRALELTKRALEAAGHTGMCNATLQGAPQWLYACHNPSMPLRCPCHSVSAGLSRHAC